MVTSLRRNATIFRGLCQIKLVPDARGTIGAPAGWMPRLMSACCQRDATVGLRWGYGGVTVELRWESAKIALGPSR